MWHLSPQSPCFIALPRDPIWDRNDLHSVRVHVECVFHLAIWCFYCRLPHDRLDHHGQFRAIRAPVCGERVRAPTPGDCAKEWLPIDTDPAVRRCGGGVVHGANGAP